jgi:predicted RNase H-like nuclease (RuvC/YqgF family)
MPWGLEIMSTIKDLKLAEKSLVLQQQVVTELNTLVRDIERCEKTILDLQTELGAVNAKYPTPWTTRQDIAYLTDLLKCANKKLAWEKQIASMQKRTPATLEKMAQLLNDPKNPPVEEMRVQMLQALQGVQAAMERLQSLKAE